jgi:hypothetical protein
MILVAVPTRGMFCGIGRWPGDLANVRPSVITFGGTVETFIEMVSTTRRSARPTATLPEMLK